jgi:hypothetical protein
MLLAMGIAAIAAARADGALFKMVSCASTSGAAPYATSTNTVNSTHPSGIFEFHNWCGGGGGDPPGDAAYLRINENQSSGNAGENAYGDMSFDTPSYVHFKTAGGYTRQPNAFNGGWRARFWMIDFGNNGVQLLTQGAGLPNSGTQWASSNIFGPHLWPFGSYLDFWQFVYEMKCVRAEGCDRTNYNATDANGFVFILSDDQNSQVGFTNTGSPFMQGQWVSGTQNVTWNSSDQGSGLRFERLRADGGLRYLIDYQAAGACNATWSQTNGEWSRVYQPCPTGGPFGRVFALDTTTLSDGGHNLSVCTQDFAQFQGLNGTGSETCDQRTIHVDNTAPGAPPGLNVVSSNPARYLDHFGAIFSLPPNEGSPITKVHYDVVNAAGDVVKQSQTVAGTNPTELKEISGPAQAGEYTLRVWLEDAVGHVGPMSSAPIPHDTMPPAAPQGVSVTPPSTGRAADGFDVRWHNIVDSGSPIDAVHYQILNASGGVVVPNTTVSGPNVESIANLETPRDRGRYTLRLWLSDAEGNVGAPITVPLAYDCVRSDVKGGASLTAGLGEGQAQSYIVEQGQAATVSGVLTGPSGAIAGAPLCVYDTVVTDSEPEFEGIAVTGENGGYRFAIAQGASRHVEVMYRPDQRQLTADATLYTRVRPTFNVVHRVVRNKSFARFFGEIPGPHNDQVVVVLQARVGHGWKAFRRYRTRNGGKFAVGYLFNFTTRPTTYVMRVQVRSTVGYPYLQGNSRRLSLRVLPVPSR